MNKKLRRRQLPGFRDPKYRWGWQSIYYYSKYSNGMGKKAELRTRTQIKTTRFMFRIKKYKMSFYALHNNQIMVYYENK